MKTSLAIIKAFTTPTNANRHGNIPYPWPVPMGMGMGTGMGMGVPCPYPYPCSTLAAIITHNPSPIYKLFLHVVVDAAAHDECR